MACSLCQPCKFCLSNKLNEYCKHQQMSHALYSKCLLTIRDAASGLQMCHKLALLLNNHMVIIVFTSLVIPKRAVFVHKQKLTFLTVKRH